MILNKITNINFNSGDLSVLTVIFVFYMLFEYNKKEKTDAETVTNIVLMYSILLIFSENSLFRCLINIFCILLVFIIINNFSNDKIVLILLFLFLAFLFDMYMNKNLRCKFYDPSLNSMHIKKYKICDKEYRVYFVYMFVLVLCLLKLF